MKHLPLLALIIASMLPVELHGKPSREMIPIKNTEHVTIRGDRAYILFRKLAPDDVVAMDPVFLRVPGSAEMDRYHKAKQLAFEKELPGLMRARASQLRKKEAAERAGKLFRGQVSPPPTLETFQFVHDDMANVEDVRDKDAFVRAKPESVYLVETIPGDYILYGISGGSNLYVCLCLGTVGFSAKAGEVTDLGYFLSDFVRKRSKLPELEAESNFGPSSDAGFIMLSTATVRPTRPGMTIPATIDASKVQLADYHAVGKFAEPRAFGINRLVPVPGVLSYDGGKVIDLKSGRIAPDRY